MIKFSFNQIKFLSSSAVILLCWQSLAIANPSINKKLKIQPPPDSIAQTFPSNEQDVLVPNPTIKIDGKIVENTQPVPPPFSRAVAPPVGDMSVSNVTNNFPIIDLGTNATVPRLVLRDAPATEVLALLSRAAGLNIIFTDQQAEGQTTSTVSLDLQDEPVQDVFNSVLMISGLKANRQGNTIFVGSKLPPSVKNTITRSIRLNQYSAVGAARFLGTLGAQGNIIQLVETRERRDIVRTDTGQVTGQQTSDIAVEDITEEYTVIPLDIKPKEGEVLVLEGLTVHADPVHETITLVGEPHLIQVATNFLTQLDIRRRQVAVNVKVIDIALDNNTSFGMSFSGAVGDTGIIQQGGLGVINFGTSSQNLRGFPSPGNPNTGRITPSETGADLQNLDINQSLGSVLGRNFNVPQAFIAQIRANIQSGNGKVLTDPTLVVQEGQVGTVELVQDIVTSVVTEVDPETGIRTITPEITPAGLILSVNISKIDDNGFISLEVSPSISTPGTPQTFDSGGGASNIITPLIKRNVSSGKIRLRDGQTIILSGIITDEERNTVSKVPILGDLPLIGTLFRATNKDNRRSEVIVMLTPQVIDDAENNSGFGYNYTPSRETGDFLRDRGLNVPTNPY
ncbi:secretin and TonB N-terminal domain-containing protein [Geminocystis sp. NIES-3709]|uniref:secretin and TonB N-terminal domain-containing protein n=1 Tax=Geminocystis sp. NIES-3709 TaxID=1617448 RepID=UPI0005FC7259|nr:secretin and TonB N-terminal domain-containing protein [Geminocystis sp. NIES-3709]BAQ65103.1 type IV pilus biogenesis protein PilQ [Geminocystis sp. NIES-3709]